MDMLNVVYTAIFIGNHNFSQVIIAWRLPKRNNGSLYTMFKLEHKRFIIIYKRISNDSRKDLMWYQR
jgi:hypothetical protein